MTYPEPTLECQDCGVVIRRLTQAEAQCVADRPYDFIVYCRPCANARIGGDR
jgi:hypothetical protein